MTYKVEICSYNNEIVLADLTSSKHVATIIKLLTDLTRSKHVATIIKLCQLNLQGRNM